MPSLFNQSGLHVSSVADLIAYWAVRTPEALAIVAPDRQPLSYGQLQIHLVAVGEQLRTLGVGRRDRLALVLPNGPEMAVAFVAVVAHAVCAPLNPAYRAPEL
jgi:oxalate---CoA ligase